MGLISAWAAALISPTKESVSRYRGLKGEAQGATGLMLFLPSGYRVLNDLLIPFGDATSQIDHAVVSNYGIFVIESKNVSGSIYGKPDDSRWTACLGPKKFSFYNPIRQNATHIRALMEVTGLAEHYFHSVVFFWSDHCRFATPMPDNVRQMGLCSYIQSKRRFLLATEDVTRMVSKIESRRRPNSKENMAAHIEALKRRFPS
jgi:hypothetical protein